MNFTVKWMNESYFESIFAIFDEKSPFLSILDTFWTIFGHFSYSTSIKESLTIELNYLLNWISRIFLNWIIFWIESWVKQYWIEYWMNHFFVKFKHWIESESLMLRKTAQLVSCFVPTGEGNGNLLPWYISLGSGLARNHVLCWQDLWQHDNITRWLFGMCKELEWWWHLGARAIRPFSTSLWLFTLEQIYTFLYFETFYLTKNWYQ